MAYAQKAEIYNFSKVFDPVTEESWLGFKSEMDRLTLANADMALALDPSIGLAHMVRARVHFDSWRVGPALEELDQALRLNPNDAGVLRLITIVESVVRDRPEVAMQYAERAIELDPNNSGTHMELAFFLHFEGRHAEASEAIQKCIALAPTRAACRRTLIFSEFARGENEAALDAVRVTEEIALLDTPATTAWIAYSYGLLGQPEDARRAFAALEEIAADTYVDPGFWAWAYMGIRDYDGALAQLNRAAGNLELIKQGNMTYYFVKNISFDPVLE